MNFFKKQDLGITEVLKKKELKVKVCNSCQKPTLVCKSSKVSKQCTYCTKILL